MKPSTLSAGWLMVGSTLVFAVMSALLRYASYLHAYHASFFRFSIGLGVLGLLVLTGKIKLQFSQPGILFLRGLFGAISVYLFFLSIARIGLAEGTVISYTFPVFGTIFSRFYLKEKVSLKEWLLILVAFSGIYLIAHGGDGFFTRIDLYHWLALAGALASGIAVVFIRKARETNSAYAVYFAQCLVGFWLLVLPANLIPMNLRLGGGLILLAIGITAAAAQLMMTQAYGYLSVCTGSLIGMLLPVFNIFTGILFFQETFTLKAATGAGLVILSSGLMLRGEKSYPEAG